MKKLMLILLFLSGCSSKFNMEIFNNSSFPLIVYADSAVTIDTGESKNIRFFTSTDVIKTSWNGGVYKYAINLSHIPGKYMVSGWTHGVKLQIENNLAAYIRKPEHDFSSPIHTLPEEQPIGFPIMPEKQSVTDPN